MSNICGIIAEFNPLHNGHRELIRAAREHGATHVVAVMSGNFVQRAEPAITEKRVRAEAALAAGVDIVFELPLPYATASAAFFARGAVGLLRATGVVDFLAFGSECGDEAALRELAAAVDRPAVTENMRGLLAGGMAFAKAREQAVAAVCGDSTAQPLALPNNALAVEYLRQAAFLGWEVPAFTIRRMGAGHDSGEAQGKFASASFLRKHAEDFGLLERFAPPESAAVLREAALAGLYPADARKLDTAVLAALRRLAPAALAELPDISEGIENRFYAAIRAAGTLDELRAAVKSKRYTMARVRRLILSAFLGITRDDVLAPPPYLRVLGFGPDGPSLLRRIKRRGKLPCSANLRRLAAMNAESARLAALEELATDLYGLCLPRPTPCGYEHSASGIFPK